MNRYAIAIFSSLLAWAVACNALAGQRDEYGYAWTVELVPGRGAHRLALTDEVYARISDSALRDLEVFNASGTPVPFGPVPAEAPPAVEQLQHLELPWFAIPQGAAGAPVRLLTHVARDAAGVLRRIESEMDLSGAPASARADVLVDASTLATRMVAIELAWGAAATGDINARFDVFASDDLDAWRLLTENVSVIDLSQGPFRLTRRRIELGGERANYLKLVRLDDGAALSLTTVTAVVGSRRIRGIADGSRWSSSRLVRQAPSLSEFEYQSIGPVPVEHVRLALGSPNSVSQVTLASRDDSESAWQTRADLTAFRIVDAGAEVVHDDIATEVTRDRFWRVSATPPLDRAPTLKLAYTPDQFALLELGDAPYTLAAGSAVARRHEHPMAALLAAVRTGRPAGAGWKMPTATLTAPVVIRGDAALSPTVPAKPLKVWLLWAVLVIGAIAVIAMVLRLLRTSPA